MSFILDISSRGHGKTTRLVEFARSRINIGKPCLIILPSSIHIDKLKLALKECNSLLFDVIEFDRIDKVTNSEIINLNKSMFLYDDFDYYIDKINPEWLTFKGYYAATPIGKSPAQCINNLMSKILCQ